MNTKEQIKLYSEMAMSLGIQKSLTSQKGQKIISHMPLSFYPYSMSEKNFLKLSMMHEKWQSLIVKVAADYALLERISTNMIKNDAFMKRIWQMYVQVKDVHQHSAKVACTRIDYMGDEDPKLVQFNLMSVGLNGNSDKVQQLTSLFQQKSQKKGYFPKSQNQSNICHQLLLAMEKNNNSDGIVVMVVHQPQFNFGDQNYFKLQMLKRGHYVVSLTMEDLIKQMVYDKNKNDCFYGGKKISAFYFRTGYSPHHFPNEEHWDIRYKMEHSNAIKLPSVDMLLVNSKRMQAELAKKQVLVNYMSAEEADQIIELSGQIHDFDRMEKEKLQQLLKEVKNEKYVLKPNRQGGGNNYFGQKAYEKMLQMQEKGQLHNYILMKEIQCRKEPNIFIFDYKSEEVAETTAQYSTFGCFVYKAGTVIENKCGGFLVRLKKAEQKQGGIAINKAAIASLCVLKDS